MIPEVALMRTPRPKLLGPDRPVYPASNDVSPTRIDGASAAMKGEAAPLVTKLRAARLSVPLPEATTSDPTSDNVTTAEPLAPCCEQSRTRANTQQPNRVFTAVAPIKVEVDIWFGGRPMVATAPHEDSGYSFCVLRASPRRTGCLRA
jgi:hypothetical protein